MSDRLVRLARLVSTLYPEDRPPGILSRVRALVALAAGDDVQRISEEHGLRVHHLKRWGETLRTEGDGALLGLDADPTTEDLGGARRILGQMLLGVLAEKAFEQKYRSLIPGKEFGIEDDRQARTDTDYRVLNGRGRPVFRINIKFHGTLFRKAEEMVGLAPEDCFALATYKIWGALRRQEEEHLPYMFVVVSVPDVTADVVGQSLPEDQVWFAAVVKKASRLSGVRDVEERIVEHLISRPSAQLTDLRSRLEASRWTVISAKKADALVRRQLYDRVYALRVRAFAMNYRGAEVDMHFSLSQDMLDLEDLARILDEHGIQGVVGRLSDGHL